MWRSGGTLCHRVYLTVALCALVVHEFLPASWRPVSYALIAGSALVPLGLGQTRVDPVGRLPWGLLTIAMAILSVGNILIAMPQAWLQPVADQVVTLAHAVLLAAATVLLIRRGRNDMGGLIDASVVATATGGVLWICLLQPQLSELGSPLGAQAVILVSTFVLSGVLGGLSRVWIIAQEPLPALRHLLFALLLALVGNTALSITSGSLTAHRPAWVEAFFLLAYVSVGAARLHPSAERLPRPGPVVVDRLSTGRLVFLGAAIVVNPLLGGGRVLLGLPADGLLLALSSLAVGPLVMVRIGRLAAQREQVERALQHQASHDALTGLLNRAELLRRLDEALSRERARSQPQVVLLFCDLNGFKAVNDRLGHLIGDQLLVEVAVRLGEKLTERETLARYGGDEFLVLCEDPHQRAAATRLCRYIESSLHPPFDLGGEMVKVSSSVGVVISTGELTADELVRQADEAMYRDKSARRGRRAEDQARSEPLPVTR